MHELLPSGSEIRMIEVAGILFLLVCLALEIAFQSAIAQ